LRDETRPRPQSHRSIRHGSRETEGWSRARALGAILKVCEAMGICPFEGRDPSRSQAQQYHGGATAEHVGYRFRTLISEWLSMSERLLEWQRRKPRTSESGGAARGGVRRRPLWSRAVEEGYGNSAPFRN